uniref:Uncharacterized protein n=1 Tax=Tetraselmis sp. GSL018 TaxID=582737 RepID=A0A061RC09_9CHLO|mmetsp:Transcript_6861/g.16592  ORF Transcript_6861/g.16592 Transcript_6861/m.16592 type:complete len:147 (-) Transcript_6861:69-509(-)
MPPYGKQAGVWVKNLRARDKGKDETRMGTLTSSMVEQSPKYISYYKTTGKQIGCMTSSDCFDYTGAYSLTGQGKLKPIKPSVAGHDVLFEGCKFAGDFYKKTQDRKKASTSATPEPAPKKERVWNPPDQIEESSLRKDQHSSIKLR